MPQRSHAANMIYSTVDCAGNIKSRMAYPPRKIYLQYKVIIYIMKGELSDLSNVLNAVLCIIHTCTVSGIRRVLR